MTQSTIEPYLMFGGRCEEALNFYVAAIGAKIEMLMHYKDSPEPTPPGMVPPGYENKVMHSTVTIGGAILMAADGCGEESNGFGGFSLSLSLATIPEAQRIFTALADGGKIKMPLSKTFWSPQFGMLTDRFGVAWMITVKS